MSVRNKMHKLADLWAWKMTKGEQYFFSHLMRPEYSHWDATFFNKGRLSQRLNGCKCNCVYVRLQNKLYSYFVARANEKRKKKKKKTHSAGKPTARAVSKLPTGTSAASAICDYAWVLEIFERARSGLCAIHLLCNTCMSIVATILCRAYKHLLAYIP